MKNFQRSLLAVGFILIVAAFVLVVPAFAQGSTPTPPPTVPDELRAALIGLIGFVVTQGIKSLSTFMAKYKWLSWIDISGWGSVITAFIVTGVVFYVNMGLIFVPASYVPLLPLIFKFLISLLAAYGLHLTMKTVSPAKG